MGDTKQAIADPVLTPLHRNRDFTLLWSGQAVSALGNELSAIGYPLLALAVTGSAARAGLVGSSELVTMLALLLPAGATADRRPRKQVMVLSALLQALALASVAVAAATGHVTLVHLVVAGALEGAGSAYYLGANRGALRRVVPPPQLPTALSRSQARDQTASVIGPPLGGLLFSVARFLPFAFDAFSFGVIAVTSALVRQPVDPVAATQQAGPQGVLRRLTAGLRFVAADRYLRTVAAWAALVNFTATGMMLSVIVLARSRGAGPSTIGTISAIFSVGGLLGALLAPTLIQRFSRRTLVLLASWLLVPCPVAMFFAPSPVLIGVAGAVSVCAVSPVNVILLSRAYELTPHHMQGQSGNAMLLLGFCLKWSAPTVFGVLADTAGPGTAVLVGAGLYGVTAMWLQGRRVLRQLEAPVSHPAGVEV
ncbi:MFS transporter [Streptomyces sp. SL13]|jgi:MFS family permease|uniref:MFS transporter n=1 Tax=Streptantibioticus silvisoli TaxID=2705255 RepID=A0AA90KGV7_9ACTN|nr:MFS transporter [Streptantibioticus silvisoli]MDI5966986.1 MFS transporter [Streptantibioticus silvisoli]MDI5971055.1 MFS transporter [Streptantibioticus silvisoli]